MEQTPGVLVCVTLQMTCGRLIAEGARIAEAHSLPLYVIHAVHPGSALMGNPSDGEALDYLYAQAAHFGAEMTMIRCQDPLEAVAAHARKVNAAHVVLGAGRPQRDWQPQRGGQPPRGGHAHRGDHPQGDHPRGDHPQGGSPDFNTLLQRRLPGVQCHIVMA